MVDLPFHPGAAREYEKAYAWYFARNPQTAAGFAQAVSRAVHSIDESPHRWPLYGKRYRYYMLKRYPYLIVYRVRPNDVKIIAVAHSRRKPGYWKRRS